MNRTPMLLRWSCIFTLLALASTTRAQPTQWAQLSQSAKQLTQQGKYREALPIAQQMLKAAEAGFSPESPQVASSLGALRAVLVALGRYSEAEPFARRALAIDQKLEPDTPTVSDDMTQLGGILLELGKTPEAGHTFAGAFTIDSKLHGPQDPSVAADLRRGCEAFVADSAGVTAEGLCNRALEIDVKVFGQDSLEFARDAEFLGGSKRLQGKLDEAVSILMTALPIFTKKLGPDHPDVAQFLNQLGLVYLDLGRPWDAAHPFESAVMIDEKKLGPSHPTTAMLMGNLAVALAGQGKYEEAALEYQKAIDATEKAFGKDHPQRARQLKDLALLQMKQGLAAIELNRSPAEIQAAHNQIQQGCLRLQDAVGITARTEGRGKADFAEANGNLAECYRLIGNFTEADSRLKESIATSAKVLGPNSPEVARELSLLAGVAKTQSQFPASEHYYQQALAIDEKTLGPDHPKTQAIALESASNYFAWKKPDQAEPFFDRAVAGVVHDLKERSFYMSEADRMRFLATVSEVVPSYLYFAYTYPNRATLIGKTYNLVLNERGVAASGASAIRSKILSSGDKDLIARFDKLTNMKRQVLALELHPEGDPATYRENLAKLQKEANRLEEGMPYYSANFAGKSGLTDIGWHDIQKVLRPGEAAVEYVRFVYREDLKPQGFYAALVLTKESDGPKLIPLGGAVAAEKTIFDAYQAQQAVTRGISTVATFAPGVSGTKDAYQAFWKPIESTLANAKKVYVAADGILNQFPLGLLSDSSGKLVLEKYDLRLVSSTKDLVDPLQPSSSKAAVVMGNPSFDLTEAQQRAAVAKLNMPTSAAPAQTSNPAIDAAATRGGMGEKLAPLPATQAEVDAVAKLLDAAGWHVQEFTGDLALKEAVLAQRGPRLLHIATHGYFLPDRPFVTVNAKGQKQIYRVPDPMLRSGLFFAGADRAQSGATPPAGLDDGVLTSYEATQLNLQGTELVVLSACETGRGDQQNGEGVFGLRRALQEAGAQAVLMSMWSVPDKETQELMTLFYTKWLGGVDKHEALRQAQIEERAVVQKRYGKDLPFYWGAFVLVGR